VGAVLRAIDKLIDEDDVSRHNLLPQRSHRAHANDKLNAQRLAVEHS
jgi:hypothetical protein